VRDILEDIHAERLPEYRSISLYTHSIISCVGSLEKSNYEYYPAFPVQLFLDDARKIVAEYIKHYNALWHFSCSGYSAPADNLSFPKFSKEEGRKDGVSKSTSEIHAHFFYLFSHSLWFADFFFHLHQQADDEKGYH